MLILGAGLNGCLAAFKFKEARILEYLQTPAIHRAVLRFRTDAVSRLTGIPFKEVSVIKGIVVDGEYKQPNPSICNQYSLKVSGKVMSRSIDNLESSKRFIAPDDFHIQMLAKLHSRIEAGADYKPKKCDEPIISTLPLPVLCDKIGIDNPIPTERLARPIHVRTIVFNSVDVYQTVYYPSVNFSAYRASMTGNVLIIEGVEKISARDCMTVIRDFGLSGCQHTFKSEGIQQFGKFVPLESVSRKALMLHLTNKHGVYSLGRHATWRKIMLDDVPGDLDVIERLINIDEYEMRIGK